MQLKLSAINKGVATGETVLKLWTEADQVQAPAPKKKEGTSRAMKQTLLLPQKRKGA